MEKVLKNKHIEQDWIIYLHSYKLCLKLHRFEVELIKTLTLIKLSQAIWSRCCPMSRSGCGPVLDSLLFKKVLNIKWTWVNTINLSTTWLVNPPSDSLYQDSHGILKETVSTHCSVFGNFLSKGKPMIWCLRIKDVAPILSPEINLSVNCWKYHRYSPRPWLKWEPP